MRNLQNQLVLAIGVLLMAFSIQATAVESTSVVGVAGYDLVSYHAGKKPLQGNGNHVVRHEGVNYLFASRGNAETFKADPDKYLPAYGGYCAFGVAVGKKFVGDPTVWEVVDGTLYLNLDNGIKKLWAQDIPGHIAKAEENWPQIRGIAAAEL